jgi:hypothetical protein
VKIRVKTLRLQSVRPTEYYWQCVSHRLAQERVWFCTQHATAAEIPPPHAAGLAARLTSPGVQHVSPSTTVTGELKTAEVFETTSKFCFPDRSLREVQVQAKIGHSKCFLLITGIYLFNDTVNSSDYTVPNYMLN